MSRSSRALVAVPALAMLAIAAVPPAADAALLAPPTEPPKTDIALDGLAPRIVLDASMRNAFPWVVAEPRIRTTCRDGRAPFPAKVAMLLCEIEHGGRERGDLRRSFAFSGDRVAVPIGGGLPVPLDTRALDPQVVPLPAGVWLLATALGGLAVVRRARRRSAPGAADA
jgi:hypothetical protein